MMRKRVFAPVTVPNEPWRERLGKVASRRSIADRAIRTLHAEALVSLQRRPVSAEAQRVSPPAPADQARKA